MSLLEPATPDVRHVCRRPEHRARPGHPNVWETPPREMPKDRTVRVHHARILCLGCPALDWCEDRLARHETAGVFIDGVVAARYCDVTPRQNVQWQSTCLGCGCKLVAMRTWKNQSLQSSRDHLGEGLCRECYPSLSRTRRPNRFSTFFKEA